MAKDISNYFADQKHVNWGVVRSKTNLSLLRFKSLYAQKLNRITSQNNHELNKNNCCYT